MPGKTGSKRRTAKAGPDVTGIPPRPGAYVLAIRLSAPVEITAGGLPPASLLPGWYAYAGSARGPGGLAARIRRHVSPDKRPRWHVDALTLSATQVVAFAFPDESECRLLDRLLGLPGAAVPLPGFGASDCAACPAHLVALPRRPRLEAPCQAIATREP